MAQSTAESKQIIDVRQAARIARDYIQYLFADEGISGIQLEEVALSDDEQYWYVTIGFDTTRVAHDSEYGPLDIISGNRPKYIRDYKVVVVRTSDGKVDSVKIREL
jgi:hypothetical protein